MKLWIDDIRPAPDDLWLVAINSESALQILTLYPITYISFDHDLGEEWTGYSIAKIILNMVHSNMIKCPKWNVHSANPVGAKNIEMTMIQASRL